MKPNCKLFQRPILLFVFFFVTRDLQAQSTDTLNNLALWYNHPAANWNEALPVGNGRLGAMIFGEIAKERLQLNEQTVWSGHDEDFVNPQAKQALPEVRRLLFAGEYAAAQKLAQGKLMGDKKTESSYQTLGDLWLNFGLDASNISDYRRELDLQTAVVSISYHAISISYKREIFSSTP